MTITIQQQSCQPGCGYRNCLVSLTVMTVVRKWMKEEAQMVIQQFRKNSITYNSNSNLELPSVIEIISGSKIFLQIFFRISSIQWLVTVTPQGSEN